MRDGCTADTEDADEKLAYYVGMSIDDGTNEEEPSAELRRFLSQLQVSGGERVCDELSFCSSV